MSQAAALHPSRLEFSLEELLASPKLDTPLIAGGVRCHGGATVLPDLRRSAPTTLNSLDKILDGALVERGMPRFAEFDKAMIAQLRAYLLDERKKLTAQQ